MGIGKSHRLSRCAPCHSHMFQDNACGKPVQSLPGRIIPVLTSSFNGNATLRLNRSPTTQRLIFEWRRLSRQDAITISFKLLRHLCSAGIWILLLPLTIALHLGGFRRVPVFTERIGHLALEPDCLLKEQALGNIPARRWFMLAPSGKVANRHLLLYWKPFIHIVENPMLCFLLQSMSRWIFMRQDIGNYILAVNDSQQAYRIYAQWGPRPPLVALSHTDTEWAAVALQQLGLPESAWFVCVHVREPGFSPVDEEIHAHRNADIDAAIPAIEEITRRGGWVIRIGDPSMKPIAPMPRLIDYAHHPIKSERLDIILCARARFILGNTSGLALVGTVFGVPCALANMIPFSALGIGVRDISISKLLWDEGRSRYLTIPEILASPVANYTYARQYRQSGIRAVENSAEDIHELVIEMLDSIENAHASAISDSRIVSSSMTLVHLQPHHYGYGGLARFCSKFVLEYSANTAANNPPRQQE